MVKQKLTPKQEKFCLVYIETGNASKAYRQAYNTRKMKEATINRNAFTLMDNSKITARLKEAGEEQQNRHNITIDTLTAQLLWIYDNHCDTNPSAAVSALNKVARLHGLIGTHIKHTGKFEHNVTEIVIRSLTK